MDVCMYFWTSVQLWARKNWRSHEQRHEKRDQKDRLPTIDRNTGFRFHWDWTLIKYTRWFPSIPLPLLSVIRERINSTENYFSGFSQFPTIGRLRIGVSFIYVNQCLREMGFLGRCWQTTITQGKPSHPTCFVNEALFCNINYIHLCIVHG